jgi:hypothetical protein
MYPSSKHPPSIAFTLYTAYKRVARQIDTFVDILLFSERYWQIEMLPPDSHALSVHLSKKGMLYKFVGKVLKRVHLLLYIHCGAQLVYYLVSAELNN